MKIAQLCQRYNMSQAELARRLEVDPSTVAKWAAGISFPRAPALMALSKIFDCSLDELVGREDSADAVS